MSAEQQPLWDDKRIDEFMWQTFGKEGSMFNLVNAVKYANAVTRVIVADYEQERATLHARMRELEAMNEEQRA